MLNIGSHVRVIQNGPHRSVFVDRTGTVAEERNGFLPWGVKLDDGHEDDPVVWFDHRELEVVSG